MRDFRPPDSRANYVWEQEKTGCCVTFVYALHIGRFITGSGSTFTSKIYMVQKDITLFHAYYMLLNILWFLHNPITSVKNEFCSAYLWVKNWIALFHFPKGLNIFSTNRSKHLYYFWVKSSLGGSLSFIFQCDSGVGSRSLKHLNPRVGVGTRSIKNLNPGVGAGSRSRKYKNSGVEVENRSRKNSKPGVNIGSRSWKHLNPGIGVGTQSPKSWNPGVWVGSQSKKTETWE